MGQTWKNLLKVMLIHDREVFPSDSVSYYKCKEIIAIKNCIWHFFPCQKVHVNLNVSQLVCLKQLL